MKGATMPEQSEGFDVPPADEPIPPNTPGMAGPQPDDPDQADVDQTPRPDVDEEAS